MEAECFYHHIYITLDTAEADPDSLPLIKVGTKRARLHCFPEYCDFWVSSDEDLTKLGLAESEQEIYKALPKLDFDYYVGSLDITKTVRPGEKMDTKKAKRAIPIPKEDKKEE